MVGNVRVEGLVEYTRGQLECMAADILRRRVDVPFRAPINVERLLESRDIWIRPLTGLLNKFSVEGAVCNELMSKRLTVFVDYNLANGIDDARYAAVIGEEFAHISLHQSQIMQVKSVEDFLELRQCPQWRQIEKDARLFSAAIRMPEVLITRSAERIYRETVDEFGFGDPHGIAKFVRNRLAEHFVVPVDEMQSRLIQWPCPIMARVIASVQATSDGLLPSGESQPRTYSQRPLIED
jgi:hypothetical protein